MKLADIEAIGGALEHHKVRYLIAGGMAVIPTGMGASPWISNPVVELAHDNVHAPFEAIEPLGYRPR